MCGDGPEVQTNLAQYLGYTTECSSLSHVETVIWFYNMWHHLLFFRQFLTIIIFNLNLNE